MKCLPDTSKYGTLIFGLDDKKILLCKQSIQKAYQDKGYTLNSMVVENINQFQIFIQHILSKDLFSQHTLWSTSLPEKLSKNFLTFLQEQSQSSFANKFLLTQGALPKTSLFRKKESQYIQYIALYPDNKSEQMKYVQDYFHDSHQTLDPSAQQYILKILGENRGNTANFLEILSLYAYPDTNITVQHIEQITLIQDLKNLEPFTLDILLGRLQLFDQFSTKQTSSISLLRGIKMTLKKIILLKIYTQQQQQHLGLKKLFIFFKIQQDYKRVLSIHTYQSLCHTLRQINLIEQKVFFQKLPESIVQEILFRLCLTNIKRNN